MALIQGPVWLLILAGCSLFLKTESASFDYNQPILPDKYQEIIGPGFAAKYFSLQIPLLDRYEPKNIQDIYDAGFRNLRLRCNAHYYAYPYTDQNFTDFLNAMEEVVNKMLEVGVTPIIAWSDSEAVNFGTEQHRISYLAWWEKLATHLKNKDYRLGFNLVTELNRGKCKEAGDCSGSLHTNHTKFNIWMDQVIDKIRKTGGNNEKRILILGPPGYTAKGLQYINSSIQDDFMMVEHHIYAGGPTKKPGKQFWEGNGTGTEQQRQTLRNELSLAENSTDLPNYFGAWMPIDNKGGTINQTEAENFARFFVSTLKKAGVPWSLNALEMYYDTDNSTWLTGLQYKGGLWLNMSSILEVMKKNM